MNKFGTVAVFLTGMVLGGATVWYFIKDRYAKLAEEEINSVKETFARKDVEKNAEQALDRYRGDSNGTEVNAVAAKITDKGNIADYARRIQNGEPMRYSTTVVPPKQKTAVESEKAGDAPYVIPPEEFDELDGYSPISLTYFADGVLSDEYGVIVDDPEEIVGDGLNHFGEYEDDSVFVRNDAKRCDYEILRDERTYEEFRKTLPPNT